MYSQCNTFEWMYELDESWKNYNQATEGRVLSIRGKYFLIITVVRFNEKIIRSTGPAL
jgi:hypothetical protein